MLDEQVADQNTEARLTLIYQTHSPYARKALVFAHELGIADRIAVIHQKTSPTRRNELVFKLNPLGKVPVLIAPDAGAIFDSCVICEYLATLHDGSRLLPAAGEARWRALRMQSVAQGIAEAGIMVRWETERRPEHLRYTPLRDGYVDKLVASYDWLERELDPDAPVDVGHIAIATALGWIEFRKLPSFRANRPKLSAWFEAFDARPSMRATPLSGETRD